MGLEQTSCRREKLIYKLAEQCCLCLLRHVKGSNSLCRLTRGQLVFGGNGCSCLGLITIVTGDIQH